VYDWLKDMELPEDYVPFNIVEVRFKGSRKEFYRNVDQLPLYTGDYVVVEGAHGYDIGMVSLKGELVRLQLKKYGVEENHPEMRNILRVPGERELERYKELKDRENETLETARGISMELKLAMKISDMEFQADGKKATFFYTAEQRVDFRELIRRYAETFKVKIEMRHIGYRQEASRLGGVGSCGRELCCSTWLTDFRQVNVTAARYQNLSINTLKLSGQCGRLKCCLNFELDNYMEALSEFPKAKTIRLDTVNGLALSQKTDVLKRMIWFCYEEDQNWVALPVQQVRELMEANGRGEKVAALSDLAPAAAILERVTTEERLAEDDDAALEKAVREQLSRKEKDKKGPRQRGGDRGQNRGPQQREGDKSRGTGTQNRPARNEQRPPRPDNRPPRNEQQRPPGADNRPPRNEQRPPRPDNRPPRNEQRPPRPDNRPPRNEQRPPRTDNRPPRNEQRPPRADNRPPRNEGPKNPES
jgi:cell fate regulator YaaT (PSP1 superfamily)